MTNFSRQFLVFDEKTIQLSETNHKKLNEHRRTVVEKLNRKLGEGIQNQWSKYNFTYKIENQGSYQMQTIVTPYMWKDTFDVDCGVYLIFDDESDCPEPNTIRNWIHDILNGHTNDVKKKNTCTRVTYASKENEFGHHIDVPVYRMLGSEFDPELAHLSKGWVLSNPKEFINWFENKVNENGEQLRRVVRYMKWWQNTYRSYDMLSGLITTILVAENFVPNDREDQAFVDTAEAILTCLENEDKMVCFRPTPDDTEDLLEGYSKTSKEKIISAFTSLVYEGKRAISEHSTQKALEIWKKIMSDSFSDSIDSQSVEAKTLAQRLSAGELYVSSTGEVLKTKQSNSIPVKKTEFFGD